MLDTSAAIAIGRTIAAMNGLAPLRVPRRSAALARVQVTGVLELQFAIEMVFGGGGVALRQSQQTGQPVQTDSCEHGPRHLIVLSGHAG